MNIDINDNNFNSKEYDEINKENQKRIEQMSEDEILEAQKEIFANIPSDLLEKFKSNFFSQQIKKSLHEKENNISSDLKPEENKIKQEENLNENNNTHLNIENKEIKKSSNNNQEEIILFDYEGNIKKESKEKYLINNPEFKDTIDYRFLTFF